MSLTGPASRAACITFRRLECQIQLRAEENASITGISRLLCVRRAAASSLRLPSAAAVARMDERDGLAAVDRVLDLAETGDDLPRLARDCQRIERRRARADARSVARKVGRDAHVALEAARENPLRLTASSSASRVAVIQMPRPGSLRLMSGTDVAVRADDETDHVVGRLGGAGERAKALAARGRWAAVRCQLPLSARLPAYRCGAAPSALRRSFGVGCFFSSRRRRKFGFGHPAGLQRAPA